jgi:sugar phosphate isomerase/epimerase
MQRFPTAAITDEFATEDLDAALRAMREVGMTGAELRVLFGRNAIDLSDDELDAVRTAVERHGMRVLSLASPLLKCVLPDAPPVDARFQQDVFGSAYTFEDQPRLTRRAFEVAQRTGARIIRVFSYWRTVDPDRVFERVASSLRDLADQAASRGIVIGLENEHACNVGTGAEASRMLAAVDHPALGLIWDPANASILGETPYPDGYATLPHNRIIHVHAKDCVVDGHTATWGPLGEMRLDWKGQIGALVRDGYQGAISLETHWRGPDGNRLEASTICGRNLRDLVSA